MFCACVHCHDAIEVSFCLKIDQSVNQSLFEYSLSVAAIVLLLLVMDERCDFVISRTVWGVPCSEAGLVSVSTLVESGCTIDRSTCFLSAFATCISNDEREGQVDGKQCSQ